MSLHCGNHFHPHHYLPKPLKISTIMPISAVDIPISRMYSSNINLFLLFLVVYAAFED
jgi:hypothetical protein